MACIKKFFNSTLTHPLFGVIVGAVLTWIPVIWTQRQQHQIYIQEQKWKVVTSYPSVHLAIARCPRELRSAFSKIADKFDVDGKKQMTLQDLDDAFTIFDNCESNVISAYVSLSGIKQSTAPLDCLSTALSNAKVEMNRIAPIISSQTIKDIRLATIVHPALRKLDESWKRCLKILNEDTLNSARNILND